MPVVPATDANIRRAASILRQGGVVAFPTETVYGLGADALAPAACARVFEVKRRPLFDPLIVHVADSSGVHALARSFDERAERLADAFWPGPLTLVVAKSDLVPDIVTSGAPTVAIRVPDHPVALALIRAANCPIAAPSANPFGYLSPTLALHVEEQLGDAVDLVLDGGPCVFGIESTIVDLSTPAATLLRPGAIGVERIEAIVGRLGRPSPSDALRAPGQLESHYAPRTRLVVLAERAPQAPAGVRAGLLAFERLEPDVLSSYAAVEHLSPLADVEEAGRALFAALYRLDRSGLDVIFAEPIPLRGMGLAIEDRLRRAAVRRAKG